jgi:hypothetical protein
MAACLDRLKRIVGHAERHGALVLLENLNKSRTRRRFTTPRILSPEWQYYFDAINSTAF